MTQSLGAIRDMLLLRLGVMKKEIEYHESLKDTYVNEDDVIEWLQEKYNKAVAAYSILNEIADFSYMSDGDWLEADFFEPEEE